MNEEIEAEITAIYFEISELKKTLLTVTEIVQNLNFITKDLVEISTKNSKEERAAYDYLLKQTDHS